MLGVAQKLVKDVVYLWRRNFEEKENFLFLQVAQISNDHFGF
jgi:hypothetical protein